MDASDSVLCLAASMQPLVERFGDRLTLARESNCVQWTYEGQAAIVEFVPGEQLNATFIDAPVQDGASPDRIAAVYRPRTSRYRLTSEGSARMVDDMVAFFSGVREPRFSFVNAFRA